MIDDKDIKTDPLHLYEEILDSRDGRPLRILAEHLGPQARFEKHEIHDTVVFMGSARIPPPEAAQKNGNSHPLSVYYDDARRLARRITEWSKTLDKGGRRFVVCTGGGPGIMEAANRGASEAKGLNIGLNIDLPFEDSGNPYVTRALSLDFKYFFMRKFWFLYLAKALVIFPGGFGTLDELFEVLTLAQTKKLGKNLPLLLYGSRFWNDVINLEKLAEHGTIDRADLDLYHVSDNVDEAFQWLTTQLLKYGQENPAGLL